MNLRLEDGDPSPQRAPRIAMELEPSPTPAPGGQQERQDDVSG
jgi:hypothetical protein